MFMEKSFSLIENSSKFLFLYIDKISYKLYLYRSLHLKRISTQLANYVNVFIFKGKLANIKPC